MIIIVVWLSFVSISSTKQSTQKNDEDVREMLQHILKDYDSKLRPDYLGPPVNVSVDLTILSITNLDAINMMYTVDMFLRQRWVDHRLQHSLGQKLTLICGSKHPSDIVWTPDTVFINSVTSWLHKVTVMNHKLDIHPDGKVFWGTRITVKPACTLNLKAYPMDRQICDFDIVSYAYTSQHLMYQWKNPGITMSELKMAQFHLEEHNTFQAHIAYVAGNYTVLKAQFKFKRLKGFAILQIYIPAIAVVCVSWVSLWIKRNATPARVALCITTLLTISTIWASVNSQLPRVSYVKAIDIFLMTSFCCVIFTLLEYPLVLNSGKFVEIVRKKRKEWNDRKENDPERTTTCKPTKMMMVLNNRGAILLPNNVAQIQQQYRKRKITRESSVRSTSVKGKDDEEDSMKLSHEEREKIADKVEMFARIFFPVMYFVFNLVYWVVYLNTSDYVEDKKK